MLAVEKRSAEFEVGAAAARGAGAGLAAAGGAAGAGAPPIAFAMASAYERPAAYVSIRQHSPAYVSIRQSNFYRFRNGVCVRAATAAESDRCIHYTRTETSVIQSLRLRFKKKNATPT